MPIAFYIIHRLLTKGDYFNKVEKVEVRKKLFFEVIILGGICLSINISTLTGTDVSRFSKQWYREYIVERFGIIVYQVNDGAQSVISKLNTLFGYEEAAQRFTTYYKERDYSHSKNE